MGAKKGPKDCNNPVHKGGVNPALDKVMQSLLENQGGASRHRCTYCAYEKGFEAGFKEAKKFALKQIEKSLFGERP